MVPRDVDTVERLILKNGDNHIRILSFNYTDTFNRLSDLGKKEGRVLGLERSNSYYKATLGSLLKKTMIE